MELPEKIELRKERSFSEKMNGMFTYLSQNFAVVFRSLLFIVGPVSLLAGICSGLVQSQFTKITSDQIQPGIHTSARDPFETLRLMKESFLSPTYFLAIILSIAALVLVKCIIFSHMSLYAESPDKKITFEDVFALVKANFLTVFFSVIAVTLLIGASFVFFIIPAIYLAIVFSMLLPVMIIERAGFFQALSRCFFLISGKWWSTFGLLFVSGLIVQMGSFVFYLPMYIFQILRLTHVIGSDYRFWEILSTVFSTVGIMFIYSLFSFAIGMQYFNLVERREGKGLRSYIDTIGTSANEENKSNQIDL